MRTMDKGAHFYKSDFQVHTPRDSNWEGSESATPAERKAYAEEMHHDLTAICADLRRRQTLRVERVIAFAPRPLPDKQQPG